METDYTNMIREAFAGLKDCDYKDRMYELCNEFDKLKAENERLQLRFEVITEVADKRGIATQEAIEILQQVLIGETDVESK